MVGTGERCVPGDVGNCGDGGLATAARLYFPKGLAISVDKTMYISDGKNIRVVYHSGRIDTLIGSHTHLGSHAHRPLACGGPYTANQVELHDDDDNNDDDDDDANDDTDQVELHWPTKLSLSPLDSTLHIVDDSQVIRLTPDMRLQVVAGFSPLCSSPPPAEGNGTGRIRFGHILDIGFSPDGTLFVAEKTAGQTNVIRSISSQGRVSTVVGEGGGRAGGGAADCRCVVGNCSSCSSAAGGGGTLLAGHVTFPGLSAMAVSPGSRIHVADNAAFSILTIGPVLPTPDDYGTARVVDAVAKEIYSFNRFGQ